MSGLLRKLTRLDIGHVFGSSGAAPEEPVPLGLTRTVFNGAFVTFHGLPVYDDGVNFYVRAAA